MMPSDRLWPSSVFAAGRAPPFSSGSSSHRCGVKTMRKPLGSLSLSAPSAQTFFLPRPERKKLQTVEYHH